MVGFGVCDRGNAGIGAGIPASRVRVRVRVRVPPKGAGFRRAGAGFRQNTRATCLQVTHLQAKAI